MNVTDFSTWPEYSVSEIDSVSNVLRSGAVNYWTGQECSSFEEEFASYCGSDYAIAVANGTVALELALRSLDLELDSEVIVTPRSFIASVSCVIAAGLKPVFADVDRDTQNLTVESINEKVTSKTRAIICVHLAGWPCDMDPILDISRKHSLAVIEDCSQAHGAKYKGRSVGSIGDIGCWSFCQDKIISTGGEGGMITTSNLNYLDRMWSYKDHGKNRPSSLVRGQGFRWLHDSFGSNYRMTEIQAVLGRYQLTKLDSWIDARQRNANIIWNTASAHPVFRIPSLQCAGRGDYRCGNGAAFIASTKCKCRHACYKCYIFVEGDEHLRDEILYEIGLLGIPCFSGSCSEIYREKAFDGTVFRPGRPLKIARELGNTSIMFLCDHTVSKTGLDALCCAIDAIGARYS